MSTTAIADAVTLTYRLSELPTAQHKAGLAGLVLQVRNIEARAREFASEELPVIESIGADELVLTLTEQSTRRLLDEVYFARIETTRVRSKWQGQKAVREELVEETDSKGKTKSVRYFHYEVVTPRNPLLQSAFGDDGEVWLKLWRDMIFQVPRARPTTRRPFNQLAAGESSSEGEKVWKELWRFAIDRDRNRLRTTSLSSSLLLGAQDVTAEGVSFDDRSDHNLLLHFWPLVVRIFVPYHIKVDAANPDRSRDEAVGYALAIPEVADLKAFCKHYPSLLAELASNSERQGFRPQRACIDLPEQAALDTLDSMARITTDKDGTSRLNRTIVGVEYRHLVKIGNNVKSLASGRISGPNLINRYHTILKFRNRLFRSTLLRGLFEEARSETVCPTRPDDWWRPFESVLQTYPDDFFLLTGKTPLLMRNFPKDVRTLFAQIEKNFQNSDKEHPMTGPPPLELLVRNMVRSYLRSRTEGKSGIQWNSFKGSKNEAGRIQVPEQYRETQSKLARTTFLEIRSRHGQDFVNYFSETIASVQQKTILGDDTFVALGTALFDQSDRVRVLTLLALSAHS